MVVVTIIWTGIYGYVEFIIMDANESIIHVKRKLIPNNIKTIIHLKRILKICHYHIPENVKRKYENSVEFENMIYG